MSVASTKPRSKQPRRSHGAAQCSGAALLIFVMVLAGCGDDDSAENSNDSAAFCEAIERAQDNNPFGSQSREPDLDLFLTRVEEMSAAYKDALANAPSEIKDDFETFATEATQRYDAALSLDEPTNQTVDAVIFGGPDVDSPAELFEYINVTCGIDF
jgi:hypothetical protein